MFKLLRKMLCRHKGELKFVRNIHGDEVHTYGGKRSMWICSDCTAIRLKDELHPNAVTQAAMTEAQVIAETGGASFDNVEDLFKALDVPLDIYEVAQRTQRLSKTIKKD